MKKVNDTLLHMTEKDAYQDVHQMACWMDGIKDNGGMRWSGGLHYVDIPYVVDNINIDFHPQANASGALVRPRRDVCDREKPSILSTTRGALAISTVCWRSR